MPEEKKLKICCGTSVGCIVINQNHEFLLIKRTKGVLGYAPVGGHALDEHKSFADAAVAELSEEVGIEIEEKDLQEIMNARGTYSNKCSRMNGDKHEWKIYLVNVSGRPGKSTSDDGVKGFEWVKRDKILELANKTREWIKNGSKQEDEDHLEPVWVEHFKKSGLFPEFNDLKELSLVFFSYFEGDKKYILMGKYTKGKRLEGILNGYGGKCEKLESALDCAVREVEEEMEQKFEKGKFIKVGKIFDENILVDVFVVILDKKIEPPKNNSEFIDVKWFDIENRNEFLKEMLAKNGELISKLSFSLGELKKYGKILSEFQVNETNSKDVELKKQKAKIFS